MKQNKKIINILFCCIYAITVFGLFWWSFQEYKTINLIETEPLSVLIFPIVFMQTAICLAAEVDIHYCCRIRKLNKSVKNLWNFFSIILSSAMITITLLVIFYSTKYQLIQIPIILIWALQRIVYFILNSKKRF